MGPFRAPFAAERGGSGRVLSEGRKTYPSHTVCQVSVIFFGFVEVDTDYLVENRKISPSSTIAEN